MGTSVSSLSQKLDLLRNERDLIPAKNITSIRTYNSEIKKLESQITRLQTVSRTPIKNMFSNAFSSIPFANLLTNPLVAAGALAAGAFSIGFKNDMAGVAFETLLGSKDAGKKMVEDIKTFANITPLENMPLQENAKMMLSFGISAEKIMPNLRMLGDVAMGDAEKMSSLTLAFSQVASAGKMNGQDLLQMINAGFNPLQEISKKTGKSMGELRKEMEKGNIPFSMVEDAFKAATGEGGKFHDMLLKMGETPMGKWSTFIDSLKNNLLKLYEVLRPLIIPALNILTKISGLLGKALEWVVGLFARLKQKMSEGSAWALIIGGVIAILTTTIIVYATWTAIATSGVGKWVVAQTKLNWAFLTCPLFWIVAGVIALIAAIGFVVYKCGGWSQMWSNIMNEMDLDWKIFKDNFEIIWLNVQDTFLNGIEVLKRAWYKFQSLWDEQGANAGLAKIENKQKERVAEIAKAKDKLAGHTKDKLLLTLQEAKIYNENSVSDIFGKTKEKLGISAPTIPGITPTISGITPLDNPNKPDKGDGTGGASENIASGGTRNTSINITFKNLVESIHYTGGVGENESDMEKQLTEGLFRVLNMAYATA